MRIGASIILTMAVVAIGALLPPSAYAGGRHHGFGHGFHHGHHGLHFGFGFAFSPYPYYAPVYVAPLQQPRPRVVYSQHPQNKPRKKSAYCREYTKKIVVDGKEARAYGTACLQDDGSWRMVN